MTPAGSRIAQISLVVRDYDEALAFFIGKLGFELVEDTWIEAQKKRWVVVRPRGEGGANLLLAQASSPQQVEAIGNQTGGRVFLFLETDDFWRDHDAYKAAGVTFVREAQEHDYGTVAVFRDVCGNQWDLIQRKR